VRDLPFDAVFSDESGGNIKTPQSEYSEHGRFPVVDQGKALIAGYVDDEARVCGSGRPAIVFGDHTRALKYVDFPFCMGADGVKVLRPKIEADLKYLYYFLRQVSLPNAGYDRHFKYLKRITVTLPPLPEQRRIAAILDQADALRAKRREALAQLDRLTQAIFIDMFGDPATNAMGWEWRSLGSIASKFSDGPFGSNLKSAHYTSHGVRVVRLQNIDVGRFEDKDKAYVSVEHFASIKKHECLPGDVLVATLGDPNLRACVLPSNIPLAINKADCVQIRVNPSAANASFLVGLLNHPSTLKLASELLHGQTRVRISMGSLRGLRVPVPPVALQETFAARVTQVQGEQQKLIESQAALDDLFASLQHRAFRGEL
jgi:type I restriction enzyme S subunit